MNHPTANRFRTLALPAPWLHRRLLHALVALAVLTATPASGRANGWEHAAVPLAVLVHALDAEDGATRARAARSLGLRGQREGLEPLLARLGRPEQDRRVRQAIFEALGRLGDPSGRPALATCLADEDREEQRAVCVHALGGIGDPQSLALVRKALVGDPSFLVQARAVEALGHFTVPEAVAALAKVLADDGQRGLHQRALRALGRTGLPEAAPVVLAALDKTDLDPVRLEAVQALARLAPPQAKAPLRGLLDRAEDPQIRLYATIALGAIRDGGLYDTLVGLLTDPEPAVRYAAITGLVELGRAEAAAPIAALSLEISNALDGRSADQLLQDFPTVITLLSLQVEALRALLALDPVESLPALLAAAQSRDLTGRSSLELRLREGFYEQRRIALHALGYSGAPEAFELLRGRLGLGDPDFRLRATALRSLGVLGFEGTAALVIHLLEDPSHDVRLSAASVLGRLDDRQAVPGLIARLSDPDSRVRREAVLGLSYLGAGEARPRITQLATEDPVEAVRRAAALALTSLPD